MLELRDFQHEVDSLVINAIRRGRRTLLVVLPTGAGKTVLATHWLRNAFKKGNACLFNVHRVELVDQSARTFMKAGFPFGVIAPKYAQEYHKQIQVTSIMTLYRRLQKLNHVPKVIIWDECHHIAADNWAIIYHHFPNSIHIGLTATPERLDGKGLGDYFEELILGPSMDWLIKNGYLCQYKLKSGPEKIDLSGVGKRAGDWATGELANVLDTPKITGDFIKQWELFSKGKKTLMFGVNVNHSMHIAEEFTKRGYPFAHVDGGTDAATRKQIIDQFRNHLMGMSNVNLFGEGFDVPLTETVGMLKTSESLAYYLQVCGRVLRPVYHEKFSREELKILSNRLTAIAEGPKPYGTILDQVRNWETHGIPHEDRKWSLAGRKKNGERSIGVKECPKCYAVQPSTRRVCEDCGFTFVETAKRVIDLRATDENLVEIDLERAKKIKQQENRVAETLEDLIALGKARGYKHPVGWAKRYFEAKQARKAKNGR